MADWFEDEAFWTTLYDHLFPPERIAAAGDEVDGILDLTLVVGGSVLDLCCGPGRHAVELAKRGLVVTGVDRSPFLLGRARERAVAERVDVEWVERDMREFVRPGAFDLVVNLFTSFGYFDSKADDVLVLENVHASLRPNGALVMELASKEWLARVFQDTTCDELPDGGLLVQRHEIFDDWTRIRNDWIVLRGGTSTSFRFHHTIYSAQELKDRVIGVGFADVRVFADFGGNPYGRESSRMVLVARKPGS
jgi:SAM-dependent methyltransferase